MARVLDNLLRNAVEAGARSVRVAAGVTDGEIWLDIIDDGPGLPPRARANLFQPFSGSARAGGTGLGLPIARELLMAQGGRLSLLRTGGDGTTFTIRLPLARHG
ncbi:MAG: ATP-binding protein [Alphaproteobacteria bacterium]